MSGYEDRLGGEAGLAAGSGSLAGFLAGGQMAATSNLKGAAENLVYLAKLLYHATQDSAISLPITFELGETSVEIRRGYESGSKKRTVTIEFQLP